MTSFIQSRTCITVAAVSLAYIGVLWADNVRTETSFVRIQKDADGRPQQMQTAIVRYRPKDSHKGVVVDLISAVHLGERSYYESLNKRFQQYDVVLYELVAPENRNVPAVTGRRASGPWSLFQQQPKSLLGLESQLDHIDYTRKNFVHADMSPREMSAMMRRRGDDEVTVALSVLVDMLRKQNRARLKDQQNPAGEEEAMSELLGFLGDPVQLRRVLAEEFSDSEQLGQGLGETLNRMLIRDRNQKALRVLQTEMAKGRKRIAIFYGAAHMLDFEARLHADFGLEPAGQEWLSAWDLTASTPVVRHGLQPLLELFKQLSRR